MDLLRKFQIASCLCLTIFLGACTSSETDNTIGTDLIESPGTLSEDSEKKLPKIEFEETEFNMGKISQGEKRTFEYTFKNTGDAPLIISNVSGSCGCTIPRDYPEGKIMPGEGGTITVAFDSDGKWGEQTVTINVTTNAIPALTQLLIRTDIIVPDKMKTNK